MHLPMDHQLLTLRCRLRCVGQSDIPHVFSASRYAGFNDGMLWDPPETIDELQEPLRRAVAAWTAGTAFSFTIESKTDATFLGRISLRKSQSPDIWNIGFWIHPEHQGNGYAFESAVAVVDLGFHCIGATRIEADHALWNLKSERVLKKLGMKFVRHNPEGFKKNGRWVAENQLAVEATGWKARHNAPTLRR